MSDSRGADALVGCGRCLSASPDSAWSGARAVEEAVVTEESHFSVRVTACDCGQRFAVVFAERIDWAGGEDDQTWLAVPITAEERLRVLHDGAAALRTFPAGRRFLLRRFPTGAALFTDWRDTGLDVPPHD